MKNIIADGIWPTMITPYTEDNRIDYEAAGKLIEWYIENGMTGIFAVCQSSEMFYLSFEERYELAEFVIRKVAGRINVVVSGNVEESLDIQISQAKKLAALKPDAIVFVRNRLSDDFAGDIKKIIDGMPEDMPLGMYECPYPYRRYLTDDEFRLLADSGRFVFLKDTCCDNDIMRRRAEIIKGSNFKLYNANAATFLESIRFGYNGYSGIMANFHPDLYAWTFEHKDDALADTVSDFLGMMSVIECRGYPICCKTYLRLFEGFGISDACRSVSYQAVPALRDELSALYRLSELVRHNIIKA